EYLNLDDVVADPDETYILANDYMGGRLLKFDFQGKLIGQIKHMDALGGRAVDVSVKSTDEIFIRMEYPKLEKKSFYLIRKLNRNLVQTDSLYPINSQLISGSKFSFIPADFYLFNGSIRIRQNPCDTLFSESSGKMVPRFIFPIQENHIPGPFLVSGVDKRLGSYTTILNCSEFPGYLILNTVIAPNKIRPMIFNQSTGELFTLKKQPACGSDTLQQRLIINDIDGIGHPALLSPENGLCICSHEIMDLKEEVKALCPNNIKLKFPNRRKELTDMVNKSDEGDNPILQIFHVK
ncbi:MAG: hypothetical protein PHY99_06205, partial [Bacteroidales bacterium]|nr:hypothetical protein [Bacteroidales bacterium]